MRSIVTFPITLLARVGITGLKISGFLIGFSVRLLRFAAGRFFAVLVGTIVGLFLGRRHIGIKLFRRKRR